MATAKRLASWLALRTVLKQVSGRMLRGPNSQVMGASVPEVDLASPMAKSSVRSQARMRSRVRPDPFFTTIRAW